jgi:uncharacterized repeat protein (TIGR01451 family)
MSLLKSRFTKTQRLLLITLSLVLVHGVGLRFAATEQLGLTKVASRSQSSSPRNRRRRGTDPLRFLRAGKAERVFSPAAPVAPTVTATKTDSLFTDVDSDTQADPGDTIKYTVNINASGGDATGVTFTDTVDPNTAFVPGSLTATPVAVDEELFGIRNVRISAVAAPGGAWATTLRRPQRRITAPPNSANGGNVTLTQTVVLPHNPPWRALEGADTFTYTLTNSAGSNNATVMINVSGMIWFIDNQRFMPLRRAAEIHSAIPLHHFRR